MAWPEGCPAEKSSRDDRPVRPSGASFIKMFTNKFYITNNHNVGVPKETCKAWPMQ